MPAVIKKICTLITYPQFANMATNRFALIRYKALDKCFRNTGRRYFAEDLLEEVNKAIYDFSGSSDGIRLRQLYDDIRFMESNAGYSIHLERCKFGKKTYYLYSDPSFTIGKEPLNESEANQLREVLVMLSRFKGMPQFGWVEEITARLESSFDLRTGAQHIIGFDENPYLRGLDFITPIFNCIIYRKPMKVNYKSFSAKPAFNLTLHPWYLKQYNNRWFVFGLDEEREQIINLSLDRIITAEEAAGKFIENREIDFREYFEDIVGVTVHKNRPVKLLLQVDISLWPYIETKPLHGSQKVRERGDEFVNLEFEINPNFELESLLLSHGEKVKVLSPAWFAKKLSERVARMNKLYCADELQ